MSQNLKFNTKDTTPVTKCLVVWWSSKLPASKTVDENIKKARKAFFALGCLGAFQGDLPVLLYDYETYLTPPLWQTLKASNVKLSGQDKESSCITTSHL